MIPNVVDWFYIGLVIIVTLVVIVMAWAGRDE